MKKEFCIKAKERKTKEKAKVKAKAKVMAKAKETTVIGISHITSKCFQIRPGAGQ